MLVGPRATAQCAHVIRHCFDGHVMYCKLPFHLWPYNLLLLFQSYGPLIGENGLNCQCFKFFPIVAHVKTLKPSAIEPYCHQAYVFNQFIQTHISCWCFKPNSILWLVDYEIFHDNMYIVYSTFLINNNHISSFFFSGIAKIVHDNVILLLFPLYLNFKIIYFWNDQIYTCTCTCIKDFILIMRWPACWWT